MFGPQSGHRLSRSLLRLLIVLVLVILSVSSCALLERLTGSTVPATSGLPVATTVTVHFIDVGQGDSALIQCSPGGTMLVDGGPGLASARLVDYLAGQAVETIDLLVVTHPHEDHIGGLPDVFARFVVKQVIDSGITHTTRAYEAYWDAVQAERRTSGSSYQKVDLRTILLAANVTVTLLGPAGPMDSINNGSIVARLDFNRSSFLFMGDALYEAETALLNRSARLSADVLKVSRHGSYTSTSVKFLGAVDPAHAVISAGADNPYGHPHEQTLTRLARAGATIYRTDRDGDVVFQTDGKTIWVIAPPASP